MACEVGVELHNDGENHSMSFGLPDNVGEFPNGYTSTSRSQTIHKKEPK